MLGVTPNALRFTVGCLRYALCEKLVAIERASGIEVSKTKISERIEQRPLDPRYYRINPSQLPVNRSPCLYCLYPDGFYILMNLIKNPQVTEPVAIHILELTSIS